MEDPNNTSVSFVPIKPKHEGKTIILDGREFVLPSLSVNQARKLWPGILDLNKGLTVDQFPSKLDVVLNVIHAALSRNYPDLTIEQLGDMVDANNSGEILYEVAAQSGFIVRRLDPDDTGSRLGGATPVDGPSKLQ